MSHAVTRSAGLRPRRRQASATDVLRGVLPRLLRARPRHATTNPWLTVLTTAAAALARSQASGSPRRTS
jgi:hypothetical protein